MHNQCHPGSGEWRSMGRSPGAGGGWGRGFRGGRGWGGGAFRVGKMLADGDLRLIVLALIEESPRHGYDIIKALEEKSSGVYSPSPGVVYPTLTFLEEAGYVTAASEGNKKTYSITDAGRAHLEENRDIADMALRGIQKFGERMAQARSWWEGRRGRGEETPDRDIPGAIDELNDARRALKAAIAEKIGAPAEEQRRVAAALREAATAIRQTGSDSQPEDGVDL